MTLSAAETQGSLGTMTFSPWGVVVPRMRVHGKPGICGLSSAGKSFYYGGELCPVDLSAQESRLQFWNNDECFTLGRRDVDEFFISKIHASATRNGWGCEALDDVIEALGADGLAAVDLVWIWVPNTAVSRAGSRGTSVVFSLCTTRVAQIMSSLYSAEKFLLRHRVCTCCLFA